MKTIIMWNCVSSLNENSFHLWQPTQRECTIFCNFSYLRRILRSLMGRTLSFADLERERDCWTEKLHHSSSSQWDRWCRMLWRQMCAILKKRTHSILLIIFTFPPTRFTLSPGIVSKTRFAILLWLSGCVGVLRRESERRWEHVCG